MKIGEIYIIGMGEKLLKRGCICERHKVGSSTVVEKRLNTFRTTNPDAIIKRRYVFGAASAYDDPVLKHAESAIQHTLWRYRACFFDRAGFENFDFPTDKIEDILNGLDMRIPQIIEQAKKDCGIQLEFPWWGL